MDKDQLIMAEAIEQLQVRDSMKMYNSVVKRYFTLFVNDFTRKSLEKKEETCVATCVEKFLNHSHHVGMRFAELSNGQSG